MLRHGVKSSLTLLRYTLYMKTFPKNLIGLLLGGTVMLSLSGCNANGRFALHASLTGQLATATASAKESGDRYTIDVRVATQGIYNFLRGKRTEHYRSVGHIRHGLYYSDRLTIERWSSKEKMHDLIQYRMDYHAKKIIRTYQKWVQEKQTANTSGALDHFGHNDYLTLFHNALKQYGKSPAKRITYIAAGSEETHGKVPIYLSHDPKLIRRWGGPQGGTLLQMGIHKGIFKNGKGSMTVLLDAHNHPRVFYFSNMITIGTLKGTPTR